MNKQKYNNTTLVSLRSHIKNSCFGFHQVRVSKHLEIIKAVGQSDLVLSSVSRCLEPLLKDVRAQNIPTYRFF